MSVLQRACRFCSSTNCEHGDHCDDCGCPKCGMPGARFTESNGNIRGFCSDCEWEAVPGAYKAWQARQPKLNHHQMYRQMMTMLGGDLPPDDEVGPVTAESYPECHHLNHYDAGSHS